MPYILTAYGLSDTGLVRKNNEDVWGSLPEHHLFVLADGMGGHQAGEVAAREATNFFIKHLKEYFEDAQASEHSKQSTIETIRYTLEQTNHFVYQLSKTHELLHGMGTTMLAIYFNENTVIWAHIGDSRIYRLRGGELEQLTKDHSLFAELLELGQVSDRHVEECSFKNVITRAIGTEAFVEPTVDADTIYADDLYLLCSDGLTDLLSNDEIADVLSSPFTVEEKVRLLIVLAKKKGGYDNITCVCVEVKQVREENSQMKNVIGRDNFGKGVLR